MLFGRAWHRTAFDREHNLYIISGINYIGSGAQDVRDNERLDTNTEKLTKLSRIPTPVYAFGCCYAVDKVYVFGGFNNTRHVCVDLI